MLAKPVTTTLQQVERSQIYVMATFGGGAIVFVLLFLACCIFSIQQKHPMLRQGVIRNCDVTHRACDANDASELLKLNVPSTDDDLSKQILETDSNTSVKCGFQRNSSDQSSTRSNKSRHTASRSKGLG